MKRQATIFVVNLYLIVLGSLLPLYKVDNLYDRCGWFTVLAFIFNSFIAAYLYDRNYKKFIILPQTISLIYFIVIWADILDKFSIMKSIDISYKYCIGFYFLLVGIGISIIQCIIFLNTKSDKVTTKVKYVTNKKTGCTERIERVRDEEVHEEVYIGDLRLETYSTISARSASALEYSEANSSASISCELSSCT